MAGLLAVTSVLVAAGAAGAQDVRWRPDFNSARKEAAASGKPLLLDFGSENCMWCRKLDSTTFRDRTVVQLINENFVPVKVDGEREERIAQAVGVQAFPTLVIVSPEGKVIARHEGYADSAKMLSLLRSVPKAAPPRSPAADLLASARADHDSGRYLACLQKCDKLGSGFAASPEAGDARKLAAAIAANPEKWKRVTVELESEFTAVKKDLDAALKR
jgi:thioredoxin-related protein